MIFGGSCDIEDYIMAGENPVFTIFTVFLIKLIYAALVSMKDFFQKHKKSYWAQIFKQ